jgi:hypothetical protein
VPPAGGTLASGHKQVSSSIDYWAGAIVYNHVIRWSEILPCKINALGSLRIRTNTHSSSS